MSTPLTIALPKGRLYDRVQKHFETKGIFFEFEKRKLVAFDKEENLKIYLVKNSDLPTYVAHGIAGLGICGEDVIIESGQQFHKLLPFSFGGTSLSLAGLKGFSLENQAGPLTIATSYTEMTRKYFHNQGIPVKIIRLNGSVELAPVLGLAPCIVDLVETGSTLKANNLEIIQRLQDIQVYLIANPAYYKIHYKGINKFIQQIRED
ncbi:ATP phosphoribosyltransferase [Oceanispirochaeta sp.]|jgi:ATP phosphoribosyltransferase|uniref:ATP phosphoribosyltransferase n=1 Tax=Oceanispirochaeta sp. TaxID=2035350 RepID=UPI002630D523|nr:ATP phosphoribosyltransferase [Oceanispirochaeta sp.]MDA3956189.1 ATP phosphoribosyltransferase [Oceanispirochaeta sp.]